MKLERWMHGGRCPSRLTIGGKYDFKNGFVLERASRGQFLLKLGTVQVVFHRRKVSETGALVHGRGFQFVQGHYERAHTEYIFFSGGSEQHRFRKLSHALEHAADVVAARDAARRLRGDAAFEESFSTP